MLVNILNKKIEIKENKLIELLPELKQHLNAKEINLKRHQLYYLKNKSNFKNINKTIDELQKEMDEIDRQEMDGWKKIPLYLIKQEKKQDKKSWRNYKNLL
jgi:hypothetical protein